MTWDSMRLTGRGHIVTWLMIGGIEYVFSDHDIVPIDAWYTGANAFTGVKPWLQWEGRTHDEACSFLDGTLRVEPLKFEIVDHMAEWTALIKEWAARTTTVLDATLAAGAVGGISVEDSTSFPANGVVWIGLEAIGYTGKAAGTLGTGAMVRGLYGSHDVDHDVDAAAEISVYPTVSDGPAILANRRADLYAAEYDPQTRIVGTSECIFRGYVASDIEGGLALGTLKIDHISRMWSRSVGEALPQTPLKTGYWYSGNGISMILIEEVHADTGVRNSAYATAPQRRFDDAEHLIQVMELQIRTATWGVFNRPLSLVRETGDWSIPVLMAGPHQDWNIRVYIREGDPLWALGFSAGTLVIPEDSVATVRHAADNAPKLFCMEIPDSYYTIHNATVEVNDGSRITAGQYVTIGKNQYIKVTGVVGNIITLEVNSYDGHPDHRMNRFMSVDNWDDMVMRHVIRFLNLPIPDVLEVLLGIAGTQPDSWRLKGWEAVDLDSASLTSALDGVPAPLMSYKDVIKNSVTVAGYICDRLGVLGIAPRITDDGVVGFKRLTTPHENNAETVELDAEVWNHDEAAQIRTLYEGEPLVNVLDLRHTYDYIEDKWADEETKLVYYDGVAELGKTRTKEYTLRGVHVNGLVSSRSYENREGLLRDVLMMAAGCHFGIYGRASPVVHVPCTWTAKQAAFQCGNIVPCTHPVIIDMAEGKVGVSDRLVVPIARSLSISEEGSVEGLMVIIPRVSRARPIAPCALADGWNLGALQLTFTAVNLYAQAGESDLDGFPIHSTVYLTEYDARAPNVTPAQYAATTVTAKGAATLTLSANPFGGNPFPATGVWVHFPPWDLCTSRQQAYLFYADATYGLGATPDDGHVWGL